MKDCAYPPALGEDRILRKGERLSVYSKVDMDEWQVRQNRKTIICINDDVWHIVGKQFSANEVCYLLEPWTDLTNEIPGRIIRYDEEYVRNRDEALKKRRLKNRIGSVLYHMRFLTGFLPSGTKAGIETDFGVSARDATMISIIIELLLFFASTGLWLLISAIDVFIVFTIILFTDIIIRYGSYLRDDRSPLGLFEWVWRIPMGILRKLWERGRLA